MSERAARDRRPILNAIVGVLILAIAAALFWPRGGNRASTDSLVLTPEDAAEESLQASVDESAMAEHAGELAAAEEAAGEQLAKPTSDPFPVENATLDAPTAQKTVTKTASTAAPTQTERKPIRQRGIEPSSSGSYYLVVGSYADAANANTEVSRLSGAGIRATTVASGGKVRVQVGYFQSREDAESYGHKLKQQLNLDYWITSR